MRSEYPSEYEQAQRRLVALPEPPAYPARWMRELCKRMNAGSPIVAAAARIPLDWHGEAASPTPPTPSYVEFGDPSSVDEFEAVARDYPASYHTARSALAGPYEKPADAEAWLRELCKRMEAGSPPAAAAARIPLNIGTV